MTMISKDIFLRLMDTCNVKTLKELSNKYGYKDNWATTTRKREGIPFDICVQVAEENNVTMDYLLFGKENDDAQKNLEQLRDSITDSIYELIDSGAITKNEKIGLSFITEKIMLKLKAN
ncbi:helix-turn-helix domain-containing protein [Colwellia sp. 20A7]|uniref:helix-turn-helix domain-containing protein n=1 Tax=Colwellia sp. 20A7 TaxID=2689569 RepID=UPI00135CF567|nr:helix-turn-helix domain-containing protein [Colwellia sp. 20A7]